MRLACDLPLNVCIYTYYYIDICPELCALCTPQNFRGDNQKTVSLIPVHQMENLFSSFHNFNNDFAARFALKFFLKRAEIHFQKINDAKL